MAAVLFPLFIQLHIAEIQHHINRDFHNIQHIEKPGQVEEKTQISGACQYKSIFLTIPKI